MTTRTRSLRAAGGNRGGAALRAWGLPATAFVAVAGALVLLALDEGGYGPILRGELGLAAWAVIAVGVAAGALPRARPGRWLVVAGAAAAGLIAWTALSLAWTESHERTLSELARLVGYLGFVALAVLGLDRRGFRAAAAGAAAAALGISTLAVASRLFPDAIPAANDVREAFNVDRLSYPFDYWNAVAAWCAMSVAIGLAISAHARSTAVRAATLALVPVAGLGEYLTYSRAGVISCAVGVIAVLALSQNRWTVLMHAAAAALGSAIAIMAARGQPEIADATGGAGGAAVAATLVVACLLCVAAALVTSSAGTDRWHLPQGAGRRALGGVAIAALVALVALQGPVSGAWDEFRGEDQVTSGEDPAARLTAGGGNRDDLWASALAAFSSDPLKGTGPGTFEFWWSRDARDPEYVRDAHSLYLEQLAELGLPGLLALAALLAALLVAAVSARTRLRQSADVSAAVAMTSAYVVFLVSAGVDWQWEVGAVAALGLLGAGIAIAGGSEPDRGPAWAPAGRPWFRALAVTLALAAMAVQVPGLISARKVEASQEAARDGDLPRAAELAREGVEAEPWAATPREQLALAYEAQGDYPAAEEAARAAIAREPTNWRLPLLLARIEIREGRLAQARRTFEEGKRLRPLSAYYGPLSPLGYEIYTPAEQRRLLTEQRRLLESK